MNENIWLTNAYLYRDQLDQIPTFNKLELKYGVERAGHLFFLPFRNLYIVIIIRFLFLLAPSEGY